jgi:hypothetical protein
MTSFATIAAAGSLVSFDSLTNGIEKFARTAELAAGGSKDQTAAFQALGLSADYVRTHLDDTNALVLAVTDKLSTYKDGLGNRRCLANAVFCCLLRHSRRSSSPHASLHAVTSSWNDASRKGLVSTGRVAR